MQRFIVTGASGLLGGAILERLARDGEAVGTCFRHAANDLKPVDLRDPAAVRRLVEEARPTAVVHAAACPEPDVCEADPAEARRLNVDPVRWFFDALPAAVPFVFISTDYVFDGRRAPYREADPVAPVNVYGQTKADAERLVAGRSGALVIRIPLQVGPPPPGGRPGFIHQMLAQLENPAPALVDDVLIRVPTWSPDVADAIAFLLARGAEGTFHVSSPDAGTRWYWTQRLAKRLGRSVEHLKPSAQVIPRRAVRPVDGHLITDKLARVGWSRYTGFDAMVSRLGVR